MTARPRQLSVAILGTRGVPARYGGFETFAEQLGSRLVVRGHRVTVYRRTRYRTDDQPEGVDLVTLPAIYTKHLETLSHTLLSSLHAMRERPDVALVCNAVNAPCLPLLSTAGIATVLNVDGIEWRRRKWTFPARSVHRLAEHLAVAFADVLVADARVIGDYYRERHGARSVFIPYGGDLPRPSSISALSALGLAPQAYDLCVCRFEPENDPLLVVRAHARLGAGTPLVLVGGATYARRYAKEVGRAAADGVRFAGFRWGEEYRQLLFNARATLHATEVGGTHPALLEAMGAGTLVLYRDTPENREVAAGSGLPFGNGVDDLLLVWRRVEEDPSLRERLGRRAAERVRLLYRWDQVTDAYEDLFVDLADGRKIARAGRSLR